MPGTGYAKRVIHLDFSQEFSEDPENDKIWVVIRNPRLLPAKEITSAGDSGAYDDDGKIIDRQKAEAATDALIAKLVIAARVYDATHVPDYDPQTGEPTGNTEQPLLPPTPWGPEIAAKLPVEIRVRIAKEFSSAQNPPKAPEGQGAT